MNVLDLKSGYYVGRTGKIFALKNVKVYEDRKTAFAIVTWVNEDGEFPKTMISRSAARTLKFLGRL